MEIFTEAPFILASNGSFGINTDIFETNLINQLIILGGVVFFGRDFLGESLSERQAEIINGVEDSEKRLNEATARLTEAKKNN
jgi:F-type H+-transporting ATPase subunit b